MARAALLASVALLLGACAELVGIGELPGVSSDGGGKDSGARDAPRDVVAADRGIDSSHPHEASAHDALPDVAPADVFDGGAPLKGFPSHTSPAYFEPEAGTLTGITAIDTSGRTLNGTPTLPKGVGFVYDGSPSHAVLSIGSWNITSDVTVTGGPPLIVVAAGPVTVNAIIHGGGVGPTAGPGAVTDTSQPGVGTAGCTSSSAGGQGGGFGTAGALGGTYPPSCTATGGQVFGALISDFNGGGSGGAGDNVCGAGVHGGLGGGGGGAIQISSAVSITIASSGGVNVGGGGGEGGCPGDYTGGGGGAGGMVFLEAPMISVAGNLAANGGGGGTGDDMGMGDSVPGSDGALGLTPAPGGPGSSMLSPGGAGAAGLTLPTSGTESTGDPSGGGGGLGRIWFRTRIPAMTTGATLSGIQKADTSL
jgi:hypothetical protein